MSGPPEEDPMAIIARFSFDVPFGKKEELFRLEAKHRESRARSAFRRQRRS